MICAYFFLANLQLLSVDSGVLSKKYFVPMFPSFFTAPFSERQGHHRQSIAEK
jgi:hypothetical protein